MSVRVVVGSQWGDEGKGRVVDVMAQDADMVIRFNGGANAGHTVIGPYGEVRLHLMPSGILNSGAICLLGAGMVIDPQSLLREMEELRELGVSLEGVRIGGRAHVVMPYHILLDGFLEGIRGSYNVGVTGRGIGPAYTDKTLRLGLRVFDLLDEEVLREKLELAVAFNQGLLQAVGVEEELSFQRILGECLEWRAALAPSIVDGHALVREALAQKKRILCEGQLGLMRGMNWGIYPYVTTSFPTSGGACVGAGIPPRSITEVVGVTKAYSTSVGAGPFPTELHDEVGVQLQEIGAEYGATTGRCRRCGWFDAVAVRYSAAVNGFDWLAITKLDVLDSFSTVKVCHTYDDNGKRYKYSPDTVVQDRVQPIYEELPGWNQPTSHVRCFKDLPEAAQAYIHRLGELVGVPVGMVSVGPKRDEYFMMD